MVGGYSTGVCHPGYWDGQDGRIAQLSVHLCNIYIYSTLKTYISLPLSHQNSNGKKKRPTPGSVLMTFRMSANNLLYLTVDYSVSVRYCKSVYD